MSWIHKSKITRKSYGSDTREESTYDPIEEAGGEPAPSTLFEKEHQYSILLDDLKSGIIPFSLMKQLRKEYKKIQSEHGFTTPWEEFLEMHVNSLIQYLESSISILKEGRDVE